METQRTPDAEVETVDLDGQRAAAGFGTMSYEDYVAAVLAESDRLWQAGLQSLAVAWGWQPLHRMCNQAGPGNVGTDPAKQSGMTYSESAEGIEISYARAVQECERHGLCEEDIALMGAELFSGSPRAVIDAAKLMRWLGY